MGYVVDYDELRDIEKASRSKCDAWLEIMNTLTKKIEAIEKTDNISGTMADSLKDYVREVHASILSIIMTAVSDLRTRFFLYQSEYNSTIDKGIHTHIREDDFPRIKAHFNNVLSTIWEEDSNLETALSQISDLIWICKPSTEDLEASIDAIKKHCDNLDDAVCQYEEMRKARDFTDINQIIQSARDIIRNQTGNKRVSVTDYTPGMISVMTDWSALKASMNSIQEYNKSIEEDLKKAVELEAEITEELQKEREWVQWVAVGIAIIGSIALIAVTAGGATPLVCAAVGAGAGLVSAAAGDFADNYVVNGSFTDGMDWSKFGKDCLIGTAVGFITGYGGAVAHGSAVVQPLQRAGIEATTSVAKSSAEGLIDMTWDAGEAILAGKPGTEVLSILADGTEEMLKNIAVDGTTDFAAGYVGSVFDADAGEKGFGRTVLEKSTENLAKTEVKIGTSTVWDVGVGLIKQDSQVKIFSALEEDWKNAGKEFVQDEISSAVSSGFDSQIKDIDNDIARTGAQVAKDAAFDTGGTFVAGIADQAMDGKDIDIKEVWKNDLDSGREIAKSAAKSAGEEISGQVFKDVKFQNTLENHDYNQDGRVKIVTFNNYSVLREDYDAAVKMAGTVGYEDKTVQDILGLPKNTPISEDHIEEHTISIKYLKESTYKGRKDTNAIKIDWKN